MNANLYINYYVDERPERQHELDACLIANLENHDLDRVTIVLQAQHQEHLAKTLENSKAHVSKKVFLNLNEERPTYNYYFNLTAQYPEDINVIANTDIVIGVNALARLKRWNWRNYCLALTRWDYLDNTMNEHNSRFYGKPDSQDIWMVKGGFKDIPEANFRLGVMGCDNKIAYLLSEYYNVINPSKNIRIFHFHLTGKRNYDRSVVRVINPPYKLLPPTKLRV